MNTSRLILVVAGSAAIVAGCASGPSSAELDAQTTQMMHASFRDQGIAKMSRLDQDTMQKACSSDVPPSAAVEKSIMEQAQASIQWPADGKFFGDWRKGDKLAQSGRGMSWSDKSADPAGNGGSCYNCHQLDKSELSYGTIGPSLLHYGKNRGITDPNAASAQEVVKYTWSRLWNAKATVPCSSMPRFGHDKILDVAQLRDLMSLLLDPQSSVNAQ
ncbi:MAG TPA: sulfur oxidation c-type cytochrome SoxX [Burkholderiaceae bacterium]|nr:sulfur oxidation c-type cytochrome SoxX [Burkholderiaceae bacterium]